MAFGWGYGQYPGGYFNANYTPPPMQSMQGVQGMNMGGGNPGGGIVQVRSEQEARQMQIPLDGSRTLFYNEAAGEVYAKRLSMEDGSIVFEAFARRTEAQAAPEKWASAEEVEKISERLSRIEEALK